MLKMNDFDKLITINYKLISNDKFNGKLLKTEVQLEFINSNTLAKHSLDILNIVLTNVKKKGRLISLLDENKNELELIGDKLKLRR